MLYDHTETLKHVELQDVGHVAKMLAKLDAYARTEGSAPLGRFLQAVVIGDLLTATLVITDPQAIYDIERGKRESILVAADRELVVSEVEVEVAEVGELLLNGLVSRMAGEGEVEIEL